MGFLSASAGLKASRITRQLPFVACEHCDALFRDVSVPYSHDLRCPRCEAVIFQNREHSLQREYALVITGLLLFFPAIFLPLVSISPVGRDIDASIVQGVVILFEQGHPMVAALVLFCAIFIPFFKLLTLFFVLSSIGMKRFKKSALNLFLWYRRLDEWSMLEVYMLGVLLCINNLDGMSLDMNPRFGLGFWVFAALMLVAVLASVSLNVAYVWERLERLVRL